jgi:hypothetical protein
MQVRPSLQPGLQGSSQGEQAFLSDTSREQSRTLIAKSKHKQTQTPGFENCTAIYFIIIGLSKTSAKQEAVPMYQGQIGKAKRQ